MLLDDAVGDCETETGAAPDVLRREQQQVSYDLCRAVRIREDLAQVAPECTCGLRRFDEQLEMPKNALERVVHFMRDPCDELPERRELFGLPEPCAQRLPLLFEAS